MGEATGSGRVGQGSAILPATEEVRASVERLLQSPDFRIPSRRARLLTYLVDHALCGTAAGVNEYAIGVDVFERPAAFDPKTDAVVRAEISRLRQNFKEYYATAGEKDPIRIEFPARGHFPSFRFAEATAIPVDAPAAEPALGRSFPWRSFALALAALVLLGGALVWRFSTVAHARVDSVVVLPFVDLSAGHQSGYLADGLTDEVTNDLANLSGLRVIARTSAFLFRGAADVREIGRQLNVEAVLEGSLVREGDHVRIRAQFNRTKDGSHLWSHTYDAHFSDLISVQRDIARSIADDLQLSRSGDNRPVSIPPGETTNPEAHDLYLRGIEAAYTGTAAGLQKAAPLMQAAIGKDPRYARPWFSMAKILETAGYFTGWTPGLAEQVRADLDRALELNPQLSVAHADLGFLDWEYGYDWDAAEREFRLAFQQGNFEGPHKLYAMCLADRGRFAESHQQLRIAEDLGPLDIELLFYEGGVYSWEHKFPEAERKFQTMLQRNPNAAPALAALAYISVWEKDCKQAGDYGARLARISPDDYRTASVGFSVMACSGNSAKAVQMLHDLAASKHPIPAFEMAQGFAQLGDKDSAIQYLEKAVDRHEFGATNMKQQPFLDVLHGDPRFIAIERRVGLEP